MRRPLVFAVTMAAVIGLMGWGGATALHSRIGDDGVRAIVVSAGVAFTVQLMTFGLARLFTATNLLAGWGLGMIIRLLILIFHGLLGVPFLGLPMGAALVSLAAFFFVSTLIEPFFLGPPGAPPAKSDTHQ